MGPLGPFFFTAANTGGEVSVPADATVHAIFNLARHDFTIAVVPRCKFKQ